MNKTGQTMMLSILFAVVLFVMGIMVINFIRPEVLVAKASMSCSDVANISDGTKLTCLLIDGVVPYFIVLVLSISGGLILDRILI
jgi:hypothetical protein